MEFAIERWLHILSGITWIGLLYYFNFVQVPALGKAKADGTAAGITKHVAPLALLWFRWAAAATWVTGAVYLMMGHSTPEANGIVRAFRLPLVGLPVGCPESAQASHLHGTSRRQAACTDKRRQATKRCSPD